MLRILLVTVLLCFGVWSGIELLDSLTNNLEQRQDTYENLDL